MSDATIKNKTALLDDQVVDRKYREYIKNNNTNAIESSFRTIAGVVVGSLINAVTIALFINPGGFLPGGLSGLVVLLQRLIQHALQVVVRQGDALDVPPGLFPYTFDHGHGMLPPCWVGR